MHAAQRAPDAPRRTQHPPHLAPNVVLQNSSFCVAGWERQYWGGVCLNVGCIPTKALLHTADLLDEARESKRFGVVIPEASLDWGATQKYKDQVVKQNTGGVSFLMKKYKISTYDGMARLTGRGAIEVTGAEPAGQPPLATVIQTGWTKLPATMPWVGSVGLTVL